MHEEIFLTVKEVADLLRLKSKYSVYPLAKGGEIPAVKLNNTWIFNKEQIIEHLKSKANENYKRPHLSALMNYGRKRA